MKKDKVEILISKLSGLFHIKLTQKSEKLIAQIFKFGIVGGIAFVIDFLLLFLFKELLSLPVLLSNTLSFIISTIYNYIASTKWVFDTRKDKNNRQKFIIFVIFSVIGLLINNIVMWILTGVINLYYLLSKIVATAFVMIFNFITRKLFLE